MHNRFAKFLLASLMALSIGPGLTNAHFPYLIVSSEGKAELSFGEDPGERNYRMPPAVQAAELHQVVDGQLVAVAMEQSSDAAFTGRRSVETVGDEKPLVTQLVYGIFRNGACLNYYCQFSPNPLPTSLDDVPVVSLTLQAKAVATETGVDLHFTLRDQPIADAKLTLYSVHGDDEGQFTTDAAGKVSLPSELFKPGVQYSALVGKTVEGESGTIDGKEYTSAMHYLTATFVAPGAAVEKAASEADSAAASPQLHRPLVEPLASFGASVLGEYLYVYSGHAGAMHSFGKDNLVDHFRRIRFDDPAAQWEELAMHVPAQSVALVNDGKYLYRIGGLTFRNNVGEGRADFDSTQHFARYDVEQNQWTDLTPLPHGRSSLDAAVLGRKIYVGGGWNLQGQSSSDTQWHEDLLAFDLDHPEQGWVSLPGPGYRLRALSAAAHDGKLYLIGGIQSGGFSKRVVAFDPQTETWTDGPDIPADSATAGFATSSFAVGDNLYLSGASGVLYRLSSAGDQWVAADRLLIPRMFLRLLPVGDDRLIAVGGTTNSGSGRLAAVESMRVQPQRAASPRSVTWRVAYPGNVKHGQVAVLDDYRLYLFGGNASWAPHDFSPEAILDEAFVFDLIRQTCEPLPALPRPLQSGAGVINRQTSKHNTFAVLGGLGHTDGEFGPLASVLSYDPVGRSWTIESSSLPAGRGMQRAAAHDEAIWVFGGSAPADDTGNLATSVLHWWGDETSVAPLPEVEIPHPRRSFGGATIDGQYYLVGGLGDGTGIVDAVDVFDFQTRAWRQAAAPNHHRVFPSLVSSGNKLYLYGGFSRVDGHFSPCTVLEVYDSEADAWSIVSDQIADVDASMTMLSVHGRLLFFGIDKQQEGQAKFVLFDPAPNEVPALVSPVSLTTQSRSSNQIAANAKRMMRQDADKDGKLSAGELGSRFAAFLTQADEDGDGLLDLAEVTVALENEEQAAGDRDKSEAGDVAAEAPDAAEAVQDATAKKE